MMRFRPFIPTTLLLLACNGSAIAQSAPPDAQEQEIRAAYEAAGKALTAGPSDIALIDQANFKVPNGFAYIPTAEAKRLLTALGNQPDNETLGMIVPVGEQANTDYFVVASYTAAGYIKDDDAREWDAEELLDNIRSGTEEVNATRRERGIPEMEIVGWAEKPAYDASTQRLVWSLASRDKGAAAGAPQGVNYNTLLLGREGYISLNLVADLSQVEALKPTAKQLLAAVAFKDGKRYADFNESTDRVAEYGLAALVGGVAAKKLGLIAMLGVFLAKFYKVILAALIGGGVLFAKLRGKKKET